MKKMIIYGTGKYGKKIYRFFNQVGCNIYAFCKTYAEINETCVGVKVINLETVFGLKKKEDYIIILSIFDRKISNEIKKCLMEQGFDESHLFCMTSFYSDNLLIDDNIDVNGIYRCNCCNSNIMRFLPNGEQREVFIQHHIIGGGYRECVVCPVCGALDRERWLKYVLQNFTSLFSACKCTVLHIAPEPVVYRLLRGNDLCDYYTGDIFISGRAQHKIDLTDIQFKDEFFDYIIVNHVFEHIVNIEKAFCEIKRVLKSSGKLITSFPICTDMKTIEDYSLTEDERLVRFGQRDHVRLFGNDYREYIESYGFRTEILSPQNILSSNLIQTYGLIADDIILICSKP